MPRYCVTLELKLMKGVWFDAENDNEAEREASKIADNMRAEDMLCGAEDWDHAVDCEDNTNPSGFRTILPWRDER